jgi:hypothetical protein
VEIVAQYSISKRLLELVENLSELIDAKSNGKSEVELSTVEFVTPLSILPLAAYGNQYDVSINCTEDPNSDACGYLSAIGFQSGVKNFQRSDQVHLPIINRPAVREEDNLLTEYEEGIFLRANLPDASGLKNSLDVLTGELVANVRQHARIAHYWILAQYYPQANKLCEIVVADNGIGYKKSFEDTEFEAESDAKAIQNAFEGKSSKPPENDLIPRGFGIRHIANTFLNGFQGKLIIISGKSIKYYKQNASKEIELPLGWPGSVVCINFNAKDLDAMDYMVD